MNRVRTYTTSVVPHEHGSDAAHVGQEGIRNSNIGDGIPRVPVAALVALPDLPSSSTVQVTFEAWGKLGDAFQIEQQDGFVSAKPSANGPCVYAHRWKLFGLSNSYSQDLIWESVEASFRGSDMKEIIGPTNVTDAYAGYMTESNDSGAGTHVPIHPEPIIG
jgi:hypothetical protein